MFIVFPQIQQAATIRFDNVASLRSYWKTLDRNPAFTLLIGRLELEKPPPQRSSGVFRAMCVSL
jgi:hypothetical protein